MSQKTIFLWLSRIFKNYLKFQKFFNLYFWFLKIFLMFFCKFLKKYYKISQKTIFYSF